MELEALLRTMASFMLAMNDTDAAAEFMFSRVEESIAMADKNSTSKERTKFWESVTTELTIMDPEYSSEVASKYLKLVVDNYAKLFTDI